MTVPPVVELREITRGDLPVLSAWLREPLVARWWCDPWDLDSLEQQYGASIDGTDPTHVLVAAADGTDVGLVQWYLLADEPSYVEDLAALLVVPPGSASIDYLLGSPRARGRGLAAAMVEAVLERMRAAGVSSVVVPVHAANVASWRVLERKGFALVGRIELEPDNPEHDREHVVWRRDL